MSYQYKRPDACVVVCDICGDFSWNSDPNWRAMPGGTSTPIHLCQVCRPFAIWCEAHRQYHLPDAFHRQPCVDCGGLFTSTVSHMLTRCPACRRAAGEQPVLAPPPHIRRPRSFRQMLFGLRTSHHKQNR
jgi:hypothetical protein